jgi:hypothetical protein
MTFEEILIKYVIPLLGGGGIVWTTFNHFLNRRKIKAEANNISANAARTTLKTVMQSEQLMADRYREETERYKKLMIETDELRGLLTKALSQIDDLQGELRKTHNKLENARRYIRILIGGYEEYGIEIPVMQESEI